MKYSTFLCFLLFLAGVVLGLVQLWFMPWSNETFFKLIVTDIALFIVSLIAVFLIRDNKESKKITGENSLD
jgi:hypothetical protein